MQYAAVLAAGLLAVAAFAEADGAPPPGGFTQAVPGAAATIEMVPVPTPDGAGTIWMSSTEITWDVYDVFVYGLEEGEKGSGGADAVTRPSRPYIPPDRGYGHAGHPAISMTAHGAQEFCRWLSERTGRRYRLPTEAEWEHACRAGSDGAYCFGDDEGALGQFAWYSENAEGRTHPVATKAPNAWGLYDMHGNVAEWAIGADGKAVTRGGSFMDDAAGCRSGAREVPTRAWNASDPQVPKSRWWLADAPFVGFRVVCEAGESSKGPEPEGDDGQR